MWMLVQTRCIIVNRVLNVATKNIQNHILKNSTKKTKTMKKTSEERWFKIHLLNIVIHHIKQTENEIPGHTFEVKELENTSIEILKSYGYFIESHVSIFEDMLKEKFPGIELLNVGKKLTLYFKSTEML